MRFLPSTLLLIAAALACGALSAAGYPQPVEVDSSPAPHAPRIQSWDQAQQKSDGCQSCHVDTDQKTMHSSPAVVLGCTDCHGGDASVAAASDLDPDGTAYRALLDRAHVQPRYPQAWNYPSSANPIAS